MTRTMVMFLPLITLLFSACKSTTAPAFEEFGRQTPVPGGAYTDVSVAELQAMLAEEDFTFVNVHIPYEGEIASTDLFVPYDEIEQNLGQLPADKGAKIVLYCRSDRMSRIAAEKLVSLGYNNVWNLEGGMVAWEQAGLPLYR